MANDEHVALLKQGVAAWNKWRDENPDIRPDLSGADLRVRLNEANLAGASLARANLGQADLREANLGQADLSEANLSEANLSGADLRGAHLVAANLTGADLGGANLSAADLRKAHITLANLREARLLGANFIAANLTGADLGGANLREAYFREANLSEAHLAHARLIAANLSRANLTSADLTSADLREANLSGANLSGADLSGAHLTLAVLNGADLGGANLSAADLSKANLLVAANLTGADLQASTLLNTDLTGADLTGCRVYGVSAWGLKLDGTTKQQNLVITGLNEPDITVDNIEVAQFIYLLLHNPKIRDVIDTIGRKAVLILGRFKAERKVVLDTLREELRKRDYVPILFDFDKPASQDLTATVSTLAHLARFIIADLSDPSSIPYELATVVPTTPVPVQPILLSGCSEFAMFPDLRQRYHWVLPTHRYDTPGQLIADLETRVIRPAETKVLELRGP